MSHYPPGVAHTPQVEGAVFESEWTAVRTIDCDHCEYIARPEDRIDVAGFDGLGLFMVCPWCGDMTELDEDASRPWKRKR